MNKLDHLFSRFLRARDWNVDNASKMYHDSLKWRKEVDLEGLMKDFDEGKDIFEERKAVADAGWKMCKYFKSCILTLTVFADTSSPCFLLIDFHKTDRYNRPIFVQDLSDLQIDQVFTHTTPDRIVRFFAVSLENAIRRKYSICTRLNREQAKEEGTTDPDQLKKLIIDDNFMIINAAGLGMGTFWSVS